MKRNPTPEQETRADRLLECLAWMGFLVFVWVCLDYLILSFS